VQATLTGAFSSGDQFGMSVDLVSNAGGTVTLVAGYDFGSYLNDYGGVLLLHIVSPSPPSPPPSPPPAPAVQNLTNDGTAQALNSGGSSSAVGGLVGGIVGGLLVLLVVAYFFYRRRQGAKRHPSRASDENGIAIQALPAPVWVSGQPAHDAFPTCASMTQASALSSALSPMSDRGMSAREEPSTRPAVSTSFHDVFVAMPKGEGGSDKKEPEPTVADPSEGKKDAGPSDTKGGEPSTSSAPVQPAAAAPRFEEGSLDAPMVEYTRI
jgi:hypothetical protein